MKNNWWGCDREIIYFSIFYREIMDGVE